MPGPFLKTALAASMVLAACNVTARAETGCGEIQVPANIGCRAYQCMHASGQCQPEICDYDTFYWDDITVRLRPGFVANTYFVGGTDRWCSTRWYEVHLAANGSYNIVGATIGEYSPNGVGYDWHAHRNNPPGNDVSVVADGIHMAGTRDCHSSATTLHGKLLVTIGPVPTADENQTKECDLNTGCSGSGCPGEPMARYSIHLLLASLHILRELAAAMAFLAAEFANYNPFTDWQGGHPHKYGTSTPGGHAIELQNTIRRVEKAIKRVQQECRDCSGGTPLSSPAGLFKMMRAVPVR